MCAAYELVDWVRLVGSALPAGPVSRVAAVVIKLHRPAVKGLLESLKPSGNVVWEVLDGLAEYEFLTLGYVYHSSHFPVF
jgi:hypothetical protein